MGDSRGNPLKKKNKKERKKVHSVLPLLSVVAHNGKWNVGGVYRLYMCICVYIQKQREVK